METLNLKATKYTPSVQYIPNLSTLEIRGESYPENAAEFYEPVFYWLDQYLSYSKEAPLTVNIELAYFNSSSSKILLDIFDMLEKSAKGGKAVTVNWIYDAEDEDSLEFGKDFQEDFEHIGFNMVVRM